MIPVDHDNFVADAALHDWTLVHYAGTPILHGRIYADASNRFPDGTPIRTSAVQFIDGDKATTRNTRYLLVDPA